MPNKGFISITHILARIEKESKKTGIKSVPNSIAQNFDSCEVDPTAAAMLSTIQAALKCWRSEFPLLYYFAVIQLESGARVSEILRITTGDISKDARIRIRALKKGSDRVVRVPIIKDWLIDQRRFNRSLFMDLNRFQIHRHYVKHGIAAVFGNNTKRSTTHMFRHLVGLDLNSLTDPQHAIRHGLGQKTNEAADHYRTSISR